MAEHRADDAAAGGDRSGTPLRLAVVGAGPKALFALEELAARLAERAGGADGDPCAGSLLEVIVVDPGPHPGTGTAYDPFQPPHLRLNVSSTILDAPATSAMASFPDWASSAHPELATEPYPPRAIVGRYLSLRWQAMREALELHGSFHEHCGRAVAVRRDGASWLLEVADVPAEGSAAPVPGTASTTIGPLDDVLLATGHASGHDDALATAWRSPLPLRPAVLPVGTMLAPEHVPAGCRVAVRGGALTFIDAALTLTRGRGARFLPDPEGSTGLVHERSAEEPAVIWPTTRHGLLLDAKPDPGAPLSPALERTLEGGRRQLAMVIARRTAGDLDPDHLLDRILEVAVDVAAHLVAAAPSTGAGPSAETCRRAVAHTLASGAEPDLPPGPGRAERALRRSVAVAEGSRAPGPAWALGRAWVLLYPHFTTALRGSDVSEEAWSRFRAAEQVLDRCAFGPPLDTARELLAMIDSGAVDLSWVDAGTAITRDGVHGTPDGCAGPDVVVDAVLSPPGLLGTGDPLAQHLLSRGLVSLRPGRRGAIVASDATAVTAAGSRAEGLALLGRPTEDHVIGHDTLNRHLHAESGRWAARVAHLVEETAGAPVVNRPFDTADL
ncbi:FAD/NAD(P)-binding protein [Brachybacterium sp. FME24]|uniref:FAD/NAD(P)-binding protein n=1 Tax=Brachybacterium sp. FME24 TaxID=2742605 RepID=UPI00186679E6|nr:FAD/NAD(P)-binding domain-containing protein [Brachybacterium sp. FME24]